MPTIRKFAVAIILSAIVLFFFRRGAGNDVDFISLAEHSRSSRLELLASSSSNIIPPYLDFRANPPAVPSLIGPPISIYPPPGRQTYPRVIKLQSGVLLAASTIFDPENAIVLSASMDSGYSWAPYGIVASVTPSQDIQLDNAFLFELQSGRILCAFRSHTRIHSSIAAEEKLGGQNEGYLYYRLMIYYSDNAGETWTILSTPVHEPGPVHGEWEPSLRLSNAGVLQFYYSRELEEKDQDNLMRVSHDGGLSWSDPRIVSGLDLETRDGMPSIQEIVPGSGNLVAIFESVEMKGNEIIFESRFQIWSVTSRDDGNTWGERRLIYQSQILDAPAGKYVKRNAGAPQIALVGNTLVVSFMTDEEKLEGIWPRNAYVKIITSIDEGVTWGHKLMVAEKPAAWAGLLALNKSNFLVFCEHEGRNEARHVVLTWREKEIEDMDFARADTLGTHFTDLHGNNPDKTSSTLPTAKEQDRVSRRVWGP